MFVMLIALSLILFLVYQLMPANRAYTDAKAETQALKNSLPPDELAERFDEAYLTYQRRYGTDTDNKLVRYLRWVGIAPNYYGDYNGLLQGNFGWSYEYRNTVLNVIKEPMKYTIFMNIFATILALGISIPLGIYCAVHRGSRSDRGVQIITIIGYSLPLFLIAILFIWIFCSLLGWLPPSGMKTPGSNYTGWKWFTDRMYYLALPLIVITFCSLGGMTRYVRASMIEALSMDCIRTARAKGLVEKTVIFSHAWRNALIPIITIVIGWFLGIFAGSLVIEQTFALNGMGKLMIASLQLADFDVVMLVQCFYVFLSLFGNLVVDILYGVADPRIRVSK